MVGDNAQGVPPCRVALASDGQHGWGRREPAHRSGWCCRSCGRLLAPWRRSSRCSAASTRPTRPTMPGSRPRERVDILLDIIAAYRESLGEAAERLERVYRVTDLQRS